MNVIITTIITSLITLSSFAQENTKPQGLFIGDKAPLLKGRTTMEKNII